MSVLINFKICDNAAECGGIHVCPVGAFQWDAEKKTILVDKELCIECGECAKACDVGAIHHAKTKEEAERIAEEIREDERKLSDLMVDRYGAKPIQAEFLYPEVDFREQSHNLQRPLVVELFEEDTIMCLLRSIPIKEIVEAFHEDASFKKVKVESEYLKRQYKIQELPALLFLKEGELLGKIEGYRDCDQEKELLSEIKQIVENNQDRK